MLRGVVGRNSNLVRWLNNHDRDTKASLNVMDL